MSRTGMVVLAAVVALFALPGDTRAESVGDEDNRRKSITQPKGFFGSNTGASRVEARQTPRSVGGKTMNITQPEVPGSSGSVIVPAPRAPTQGIASRSPTQLQPNLVRSSPPKAKKKRYAKRKKRSNGKMSEGTWWKKVGNDKVFAFSDCISIYAGAQARSTPKLNLQSVVALGIEGECSSQFQHMSETLKDRFGAKRAATIAKELTGSTFVPAVREAVLAVRKQQKAATSVTAQTTPAVPMLQPDPAPQVATPVAVPEQAGQGEAELERAKQAMFACYRATADRVAPQRASQPADQVVDVVLIECSQLTRAFFARLFKLHPQPKAQQTDRMREAIAGSYRPAITKRIEAIRQAATALPGSSNAVQKVTSSEQ